MANLMTGCLRTARVILACSFPALLLVTLPMGNDALAGECGGCAAKGRTVVFYGENGPLGKRGRGCYCGGPIKSSSGGGGGYSGSTGPSKAQKIIGGLSALSALGSLFFESQGSGKTTQQLLDETDAFLARMKAEDEARTFMAKKKIEMVRDQQQQVRQREEARKRDQERKKAARMATANPWGQKGAKTGGKSDWRYSPKEEAAPTLSIAQAEEVFKKISAAFAAAGHDEAVVGIVRDRLAMRRALESGDAATAKLHLSRMAGLMRNALAAGVIKPKDWPYIQGSLDAYGKRIAALTGDADELPSGPMKYVYGEEGKHFVKIYTSSPNQVLDGGGFPGDNDVVIRFGSKAGGPCGKPDIKIYNYDDGKYVKTVKGCAGG